MDVTTTFQVFGKEYIDALLDIMNERKSKMNNIDNEFRKINILTYSAIIVFFSFVENMAISIKRILLNASKTKIILIESKKKNELLHKDEKGLSFEDMMKITFSLLPSFFGENNCYGNIKNNELLKIFTLREIRHNLIHPKGFKDFFVATELLDGKDINEPMLEYLRAIPKGLDICSEQLKKK
jgi:hypothetical protein